MSITVTPNAAEHVKKFGKGENLRLSVKTTGCSGWSYIVDFDDAINADDQVFESHGIKVLVDPKSLPIVNGTEIDFVREGFNETFKFTNPNVKDACGCGESFNI